MAETPNSHSDPNQPQESIGEDGFMDLSERVTPGQLPVNTVPPSQVTEKFKPARGDAQIVDRPKDLIELSKVREAANRARIERGYAGVHQIPTELIKSKAEAEESAKVKKDGLQEAHSLWGNALAPELRKKD